MRFARGPRPWPIRWFTLAFIAQAALAFVHQMGRLCDMQAMFVAAVPGWHFDRDLTIVALSARLSIAFIPVALVWFLANPWARWLVLFLMLGRLATVPGTLTALGPDEAVAPLWVVSLVLAVIATGLLFTRRSMRWFIERGKPVAQASD